MLKFGKISRKIRGILTVLVLAAITLTVTSCKGKTANPIKLDEKYLSVGNYSATNGEVWEELQWDASALFDDKAKEAIVNKQLEEIKAIMKDSAHATYSKEKYEETVSRLQNYLLEDVYGFEFSLESHDEELEDLEEKQKETKIKQYADNVYKNHKVSLTQENIIEALKKNDLDALKELYKLYYLQYASELFALEKLNEEITKKNEEDAKDDNEDTIGYFTKSSIVSQYKSDYLNQGKTEAIVIKFASLNEADQTFKAFGIKLNKGRLCYIKSDSSTMNFEAYKKYYDEFDFNDKDSENKYVDLDALYGHSIILQLYIAMYNYIYTYHDQPLENIDFSNTSLLDQRKTTDALIDYYSKQNIDAESDDLRIKNIIEAINKQEENKHLVNFDAKKAKDIDPEFYSLLYSNLKTPNEVDNTNYERYTTSARSIAGGYYLVFKVSQTKEENDKLYTKDITEDDLYEAIKKNESLYNSIIKDLTDSKLTKDFISEKISEAMKDVKVKIFDKEIEISYAQNHTDYNKTLTGAPDENTIAEFKYNDTVIKYYLTTEEGTGLWDILEHRDGTNTAVEIIQTKQIKDSDAYKQVSDDEMKLYEESLEYILASFANNGLAQQGYPASLGKYNFLMLYYHTADIDKIIDDIFKVSTASAVLLSDYSSKEINDFFKHYSDRAYNNYFNISAKQIGVYLDTNEDGKPDDITKWENKLVTFDGKDNVKLIDVAKQLYQDIYTKLSASSEDHATALQGIIDTYNASARFNPAAGDRFDQTEGNYDPIATEWEYAKYKQLGFNISLEDITVTNSDSNKDVKIKDKLHNVYISEGFAYNNFFPSKYLEDPKNPDTLITVDDKLNYFLITGATKPASAKYESFKDENDIYKDIYFMYNDKVQKVDDVYNDGDLVNENQIKAFIFEYIVTQTTNLLPKDITEALNTFVNPVLSRYQSQSTQQRISINYIANGDTNNLNFNNSANLERYKELQEIEIRIADQYVEYAEGESDKYNNFHGWYEKVDQIKGGKN